MQLNQITHLLVPHGGTLVPCYHLSIPQRLFTLKLPHTAIRLYLQLKQLEAEAGGGPIDIRLRELALVGQMSNSNAWYSLEKLAEAGLIRIHEVSDRYNLYEVLE